MYKLLYLARRNPSISVEDWPRTWRSHAVFVSQFPVAETELTSLFYCCRIVEPGGASPDLPGVSTAHDGVAVVSSPRLSSLADTIFSPEDQLRVEQDELRVFGMRVHGNLTFACQERPVLVGTQGRAAVFRFLKAKPGLPREAFEARWADNAKIERPILSKSAGIGLAVHNHLVGDPPELLPFDGISETWFASPDDAISSLTGGTQDAVADSLSQFCDLDGSVTMLTRVCHSWQQA